MIERTEKKMNNSFQAWPTYKKFYKIITTEIKHNFSALFS